MGLYKDHYYYTIFNLQYHDTYYTYLTVSLTLLYNYTYYTYLVEHLDAFDYVDERQPLRSGDEHRGRDFEILGERQLDIAGACEYSMELVQWTEWVETVNS